ncbi:hypothetical protein [Nocardioides alpinus]|nr:hypothetical protein [Nocardioides alpinus]PKH38301.1 hypothetical protein CXG46_16240 [Nocardioides alpinus]
MPSRRNVVRSAAWTVPIVAVTAAAPAYAASCGTATYTWRLDWSNDNATDAFTTTYPAPTTLGGVQTGVATITGPAGTTPLKVTFSSQMQGTMSRDGDNLQLSSSLSPAADNVGGLNQGAGLNISHQSPIPNGRGNRQDISISFDRPVTGLTFTITDIDRQDGDWNDRVELTGTRTFSAPNVSGNGTNGTAPMFNNNAWRPRNNADNADNDSNDGNVTVTFGGTIAANTAIVMSFWNNSGNGNQRVFLSDFTFTALGC